VSAIKHEGHLGLKGWLSDGGVVCFPIGFRDDLFGCFLLNTQGTKDTKVYELIP